jgi:DNA ligase-associated metallophosphoesterase
MIGLGFAFCGADLIALASGGLYWPAQNLLCVSDLHLGKSGRWARRHGQFLPPYDIADTFSRLFHDIKITQPQSVICLGDNFDDMCAAKDIAQTRDLTPLMAKRNWIWIQGNHDPAPVPFGGLHLQTHAQAGLTFRHIAQDTAMGEISGHYHPKIRLRLRGKTLGRKCLLMNDTRLILPAYGTYTGGMFCDHPDLRAIMGANARAIVLTGADTRPVLMPLP